ncbi:MAG: dihydrolipoamide acetyltransferase family protein [Alcaligenaceae bacterium]|nr:dihydrolipoamide acetyltransferase family protein [Alcaligenaceae bacterium]
MGLHIIKMPDIGEGIAEVELVEWHVQAGDTVTEDQILADVMTDKATVQVPSPVNGKVLALGGKVGEVMAVGSELIRLEVEGGEAAEPPPNAKKPGGAGAARPAADPGAAGREGGTPQESAQQDTARPDTARQGGASRAGPPEQAGASPAPARLSIVPPAVPAGGAVAARPEGGRPLASPAVRRRAWELGIDLQAVRGSGPAGRITHADLDACLSRETATAAGAAARPFAYERRDDQKEVRVIGLRRRIAEKMQESKRRIPHFTYVEELDVTELESLRARLNAQWGETRGKLTLLPFLARAMVLALREFPQINARYDDEAGIVTHYGPVHLGIAAQTDGGLMVPVLHHAEALDLWALGREVARLAQAARDGSATREELTGSTITLTSLGPLGGVVSTPVINHPEVAIVGVNRIIEKPVVIQGAIAVRKTMNLSSSFDHRVVDGMHAAEFIQKLRAYMECPALLFVE